MRYPEREGLGDRFFIGEAALGPLSLKLPVQIRGQPHRCFDRRTGAHTTRLPKFGIFLQSANASRCLNRVRPAHKPTFAGGLLCSSIRTCWNQSFMFFTRRQGRLQGFCSEFRTDPRSNLSGSGISGTMDGQGGCPAGHIPLPGVRRESRSRVPSLKKLHQFNIITSHLYNKSGDFAALQLANRRYLLYKV